MYLSTICKPNRSISTDFDDVFDLLSFSSARRPFFASQPETKTTKTNEQYLLSMLLPGVPKESLDVEIHGQSLIVKHDAETNDEKNNFYGFSSFEKRFVVPDDVVVKKISAVVKDGVLRVNLPRIQPEKKPVQKIKIN